MNRKQKIGVLSALVVLAMGSFGVSQMAQAADYTAGSEITVDSSVVSETDAFAIGINSKANGNYSTALGVKNTVTGTQSVAVGTENEVTSSGSATVGYQNWNYGYASSVYGSGNYTTGEYSTAIGYSNGAKGNDSSAVGYGNAAMAEKSAAFGSDNEARGENSTAVGVGNIVTAAKGMALGYKSYVGTGAEGTADATGAVAIGNGAVNTETGTVSFGHKKGDFTGLYSCTYDGEKYYSSVKDEDYNTPETYESDQFARLTNVAAGTDNHDVATYGQLIKAVDGGYKVASTDANTAQSVELEYNDDSSNATKVKITVEGNGEVAPDDKRLVNGDTVYNAISNQTGDTKKLADAGLGDNVVDSVLSVNDKVGSLSNDINKVGAGAAALAALHPEGFDPADKWSFAVGYGHYKNANAGALGAFYKPNFDTTLSIGGTIGNGSSMMNAGVSFKLGQRGARLSQNASNSQLVQEVNALRAENAQQAQEIRELKAQMAKVLAKLGE